MIPSFFMKYKIYVIVVLLVIIVGAFFLFTMTKQNTATEIPLETISETTTQQTTTPKQDSTASIKDETGQIVNTSIVIDVKGAVKNPGVYALDAQSRVIDAIEEAGGYAQRADAKIINNAQKLQDEMVIYVPRKGEKLNDTMNGIVQTSPNATTTTETPQTEKVNLNTADEATLQTLNGVGPAKAQAIIQFRTEKGLFQTVDDLKKVNGFGEKTFEKLKDAITI